MALLTSGCAPSRWNQLDFLVVFISVVVRPAHSNSQLTIRETTPRNPHRRIPHVFPHHSGYSTSFYDHRSPAAPHACTPLRGNCWRMMM